MKIAIYETVHLDWVIPLAVFLKESPYSITFFVHRKMKEDIENSLNGDTLAKYNWIYPDDQHILSLYKFLDHHISIQHYDLLWLNTNDNKHITFALLKFKYKKMRLLINIHEINNFFKPRLSMNIKRLVRYISKKVLSKAADAYILNADKMKQNIEEQKLTRKPCYTVAPVYYKEDGSKQSPGDKFIVVIAGTIDERRRDYRTAIHGWKIFIEKKDPAIHAELILAGGINRYGLEIIKMCKDDILLQNTVRVFDHEIPEHIFQQLLSGATVLLSPQNIKTSISDNIVEEYGLTKSSGNTYDAIRHAKPYIIPRLLHIPDNIETSAVRYSGYQELAYIFRDLSNNKDALTLLRKKASENSKKYTYEGMHQQILYMLAAILKLQ